MNFRYAIPMTSLWWSSSYDRIQLHVSKASQLTKRVDLTMKDMAQAENKGRSKATVKSERAALLSRESQRRQGLLVHPQQRMPLVVSVVIMRAVKTNGNLPDAKEKIASYHYGRKSANDMKVDDLIVEH